MFNGNGQSELERPDASEADGKSIEDVLEELGEFVATCASQRVLEDEYFKWLFDKLFFEKPTLEFLLREVSYIEKILNLRGTSSSVLIEQAIIIRQTIQDFIRREKDAGTIVVQATIERQTPDAQSSHDDGPKRLASEGALPSSPESGVPDEGSGRKVQHPLQRPVDSPSSKTGPTDADSADASTEDGAETTRKTEGKTAREGPESDREDEADGDESEA